MASWNGTSSRFYPEVAFDFGGHMIPAGRSCCLNKAAANPVSRKTDQVFLRHGGHVQCNFAVAIKTACGLGLHKARYPARRAILPSLPNERWRRGINSCSSSPLAPERQGDDVVGVILVECEIEGVIWSRRIRKDNDGLVLYSQAVQIVLNP